MKELISAYQFIALNDLALIRRRLLDRARALHLHGTVLIAPEGINFSLGGRSSALDAWLERLAGDGINRLVSHRQPVEVVPFLRLKVRIRSEIIAFEPSLDPGRAATGQPLDAQAWHRLLGEEDIQLVDTRNDYEVRIGSFRGAANPGIDRFTEFADWARVHLDPARPVAMFCTGGVRCEKASARLLADGFDRVYHLRGGILAYLQHFAGQPSLWNGECFVFDDRVSVDPQLRPSARPVCAGCRHPHDELPANGMPPVNDQGSCRLCQRHFDPDRLAGIAERVRQIALARARGVSHLGPQQADRAMPDSAPA
ncbi:MAG: rhodanese-like domain-containing protein [Wenzhouxiangella sp.]